MDWLERNTAFLCKRNTTILESWKILLLSKDMFYIRKSNGWSPCDGSFSDEVVGYKRQAVWKGRFWPTFVDSMKWFCLYTWIVLLSNVL